jgi:hydrogenase maturation protease
MKPTLIAGLGNPMMGDEGVGCEVAERLAADPRLPPDTEVICGGTDLLRLADRFEGRRRVLLIDALLDPGGAGRVSTLEDQRGDFSALDERQEHVHHLSLVQSLKLLRLTTPSLASVRFTLVAVGIESLQAGPGLSPTLTAALHGIIGRVLEEL